MALMSTLYSPKVQWALGDASGIITTDRSGNSQNLAAFQGNIQPGPDLRRGYLRAVNVPTGSNFFSNLASTYLRTLGALTILCRGYLPVSSGMRRTICHQGAATVGGASNTVFDFAVTSGGVLTYRHQHGTKVTDSVDSTISVDLGHERFFGLRRDSAGTTVRFSYGTFDTLTHENQTLANPPDQGTSTTFRLGGAFSSADVWQGGFSDVCIWHSELSDAQVEAFWAEAMDIEAEEPEEPPAETAIPTQAPISDLLEGPMPLPKPFTENPVRDLGELIRRVATYTRESTAWMRSNPAFYRKTLEVKSFPVKVAIPGRTTPPQAVLLGQVGLSSNQYASVSASHPSWVWNGSEVVVNSISGLTSGTSYRVSLLIVG